MVGLFGTGISEHARLITLTSAQAGDLPEALAAERFSGREAVNELFCFDIDDLSTSTDLDVSIFLGEELSVGLLQPDGRRRWHGICTGAMWLGADGGVARYRLRLEPALSLLALQRDSATATSSRTRTCARPWPNCWPITRRSPLASTSPRNCGCAPSAPSTAKATSNSSCACSPPKA